MQGGRVALSKVDLHIHSTISDGRFSPADIVRESAELGLRVIALADHDSVDGIASALEAVKAFSGINVLPCVDPSTDVPAGEVHVLGYFIDYTDYELGVTLERLRGTRRERAKGMIAKLGGLGIHIEWQRVQEIAGDSSIGRPHIAQAMLEKGYVASIKEAFTRYISRDGPAYVERKKVTPQEAVELVLRADGLPVLAHPLTGNKNVEEMVVELKAVGLVGIEAYYNGYTAEEVNWLVNLADKHGLIALGGSDYHGIDTGNETMLGGVDVPMDSVERLIALARQRGLRLAG